MIQENHLESFQQAFQSTKDLIVFALNQADKFIRQVVRVGTISLIIYILYISLQNPQLKSIYNDEYLIQIFKLFRNTIYFILIIDFPLMVCLSVIFVKQNRHVSLFKIITSWTLLLLFVTFSFAIAGFIRELLYVLIFSGFINKYKAGEQIHPQIKNLIETIVITRFSN